MSSLKNWFEKLVTKKKVLFFSVLLTLPFVLLIPLGYNPGCYTTHWCTVLFESYGVLNYLLYIVWAPVTLVLLGLIWYLDVRIFLSWIKFSVGWFALFAVSSILIPDNAGSGFISVPIKVYVLLGLCAVYFSLSALIILIQSVRVYWLKK